MAVGPIALGITTVHFRDRCQDLVFQIGTRLNRGGNIRRRILPVDVDQNRGNRVQELVWARLPGAAGSAGRDRLADFFRR
jgi:hypothetical protein